jgi:hypothetical protein
MKLYSYDLCDPLDWEFFFMNVDEYKKWLSESYMKDEESSKWFAGELSEIIGLIDELLNAAMDDCEYSDFLRCPPLIFPIPAFVHEHAGRAAGRASFCIILKGDNDGLTSVYSYVPLPHLFDC